MQTILGRTLISFLSFICLLSAILITTIMVTKQQKDDGLIVNLSGRQRMLTQKMSKEALIYYRIANKRSLSRNAKAIDEKQVQATMEVFETTLYALKDGGPAPLDLAMSKFRNCPPAETTEIKQQLEQVINLWDPIRDNINAILSSKGRNDSAIDYLITHNVELLSEMNKVVFQMQHQAERKVALMVKIQVVAIGVGILVVILSIFAIKASVVVPINSLIESAKSMSTGKLDAEIKASGLKEITALSSSLNRLRMSLLTMITKYKENRLR